MTTAARTTWDGLEIAANEPHGATIAVRRPAGAGEFDYLLLHRAHQGPDFDGPWAWTPPAGARQPGEAVEPAALRELAEEAGIGGVDIHPVDLSGNWARFYAEVPADVAVDLVDAEHDSYQWVSAPRAGRICRPAAVARQVPIVDTIPSVSFTFRPAGAGDRADLLAWRAAPHIAPWICDEPTEDAEEHIVVADGRAVGYAELLGAGDPRLAGVAALAGSVSVTFYLADADVVSRGLGATFLWAYLRQVVLPAHPGAAYVTALPAAGNRPARRALERAGFLHAADVPDGSAILAVHAIDRAHWFG
ncbi:GNAT family N-acetyltransferase [Phytomonospora sp. NPDC050363]|uniref:GNAT family N-acetyltransferase n=1 Tax=Phytomonospora sp. NPDC050363 TaxID=3155642 RepID=UPI0033C72E7D